MNRDHGDDDAADPDACSMCGGQLGRLGSRDQYKCRACGMHWSGVAEGVPDAQ